MNRFSFIVPTFNAERTIGICLNSVMCQTYSNWKIIILDDLSTDRTCSIVEHFKKQLPDDKIILVKNSVKKWEVANILEGLKFCDSDDIVCRLDGDDWLCDLDALSIIDYRYKTLGCDALWTAHRWDFSNHNISGDLPKNEDPYRYPWVSSHLKTFRKKLIENVKDENFRGLNGDYFKRIGDQAIYLPVLHEAKGNWHFEPIVAYHYTIDMRPETFQTEDAKYQKFEAEFLRSRGYVY